MSNFYAATDKGRAMTPAMGAFALVARAAVSLNDAPIGRTYDPQHMVKQSAPPRGERALA